MANTTKKNVSKKLEKNFLEWIVFGISFLLVVALIGYLAYRIATRRPETPEITLEYVKDASQHHPHRYKVTVINSGGETAEEVMVEGAIMKAGQPVELSELQVAFSPKMSRREGWIIFSRDPAEGDSVTLRVISFKKP